MTKREREILELLKKHPLMTQQEIAEKLNITRSGVSAHISNLMASGWILGRAYVLREEEYLTVIGGANRDIVGQPENLLLEKDSNPGKIFVTTGGVGRNICENLTRLGQKTIFFTALGKDEAGEMIEKELSELGTDTSKILWTEGRTPQYLAIMDEERDLSVAISDMELLEKVNRNYLEKYRDLIEKSKYTVLDTNLSKEALDYLLEEVDSTFVVDSVSTVKALKLKEHLDEIHFLKANIYEAKALSNNKSKNYLEIAEDLINQGLHSLVITMGSQGSFYKDQEKELFLEARPLKIQNASGAGDSFMAGYTYGLMEDFPLEKRLEFADACARVTLQSDSTGSEDYYVNNILKEME